MPELNLQEMGDHTITLKINGVEQVVPLKDVVAKAQKAGAVDSRLRELHEEKEELGVAADAYRAIKRGWETKDRESLISGLVAAGIPRDHATAVVNGRPASPAPVRSQDTYDDDGADTRQGGQVDPNQVADIVSQVLSGHPMSKAITDLVEDLQHRKNMERHTQRLGELRQVLDSDPELGKMITRSGDTPEVQARKKDRLLDRFSALVVRRQQDIPTWGPRRFQAAMADLKTELTDLGIPATDPAPSPGLGGPATVSGVHLSDEVTGLLGARSSQQKKKDIDLDSPDAATDILAQLVDEMNKP